MQDQTVKTTTGRKYVNVKERIRKYSERIDLEKENLNEGKLIENCSFNSIKNYLMNRQSLKSLPNGSAAGTSFEHDFSQMQIPRKASQGKKPQKG